MNTLSLIHLVVFALLVYRIGFGHNSLPEYFRLQEKVMIQQQINDKLEQRNHILRREVQDLQEGTDAIEEHARYDLGFIKSNETFYRVLHKSEIQ
tara:strand:- start:4306 stop:4590 length:285 start_codon:yes stop_codon:yes gene_type:complete